MQRIETLRGWGQPLRRDIAQECFPGLSPQMAVKRLNRWIATDPELSCLLQLYGYKPRSRRLTRRQVRVIKQHL
ncbi:MAG: DUF4248 domain-containing protein [Bacteroidaceae bacterium]|nr:DUF4248 domain-containing protein [Bacteroidaceae bacterium]